jgi:tetratricopeptide (TPR) repeat protein
MSQRNLFSILIISLSMLVISCKPSKEKELQKIKEMEERLLGDNSNSIDGVSAYNLQIAYTGFYENFPDAPETPELLFRAADMCVNLKWSKQAVDYLNIIISQYPDYEKAPDALFLLAFVHDHLVDDDAKAGEYYRAYLDQYPDHIFAKDAEASIRNLGKTDEEIMREFEMNNANVSKDTVEG